MRPSGPVGKESLDSKHFHSSLDFYMKLQIYPSLTALDLGNSENIKNRNRIYDEGLQALVEGMTTSKSGFCLISELHLQSACISGEGLQVLQSLQQTKIDLQILDLAFNDLGNEAAYHLQYVIPTLVSLNLSTTKLGLKGCLELARHFNIFSEENGVQYSALKYLDLSNNHIGTEGFTKLISKLRYST